MMRAFELRVLSLIQSAGRTRASELFLQLEEQMGRKIPPSQLYPALTRLVEGGLIREEWRDPEPRRGGRRWRVFTLLPRGATELEPPPTPRSASRVTAFSRL